MQDQLQPAERGRVLVDSLDETLQVALHLAGFPAPLQHRSQRVGHRGVTVSQNQLGIPELVNQLLRTRNPGRYQVNRCEDKSSAP